MYGKLFASMFDGTLATRGPWEALVTFQQMLILCDKYGVLDMTPESLSRRTTVPLPIIERGIVALELPDPESRTPTEDGRRITRLSDTRSWGWQIVNYPAYRKLRSADERREYMREFMRRKRAQGKAVSQDVSKLATGKQCKPIAVSSKQEAITTTTQNAFAFMGEIKPVWKTALGGDVPPGTAKRLRPLVEAHGAAEVANHLANYLASTDARYVSIPRFTSTYGAWDGIKPEKQNGHKLSSAEESKRRGITL